MQCHFVERGFLIGLSHPWETLFCYKNRNHPNEYSLSKWLEMRYTLVTTRLPELSTSWGLLFGNCLWRQFMRHEKSSLLTGQSLSHHNGSHQLAEPPDQLCPKRIGCLNTKWASPITMEGTWKNTSLRAALEEEIQNWSREFPPKATRKGKTHLRVNSSDKRRQAPLSASVALTLEEQSGLLQCWVPQVYSQDMSGNWHFVTSISNDAVAGDWETPCQSFDSYISGERVMTEALACWRPKLWLRSKKPPHPCFLSLQVCRTCHTLPNRGKQLTEQWTPWKWPHWEQCALKETFQGNPRWCTLRLGWLKPQKRYKLARLSLPQRLPTGDREQECTSQEGTETPQGRSTAPGPWRRAGEGTTVPSGSGFAA